MSSKVTINDIARLAEVSKKTVSRVINDESGVREKTRIHVQKIIDEQGYSPDPQARGLASKRSFLLAAIYNNPNHTFVSEILNGVIDYCRPKGYELVIHPCDKEEESNVATIIRFISRLKIDGVFLLPPLSESNELAQELDRVGCNYVRLLSKDVDGDANVITLQDKAGVKGAVQHLLDLGHRDIGYVAGPENQISSIERLNGLVETLEQNQLSLAEEYLVNGDYTFESGLIAGRKLLTLEKPPTAIFASNDEMALGVKVTAERMDLQVPQQLSIVGFDDTAGAQKVWPSLTTVNLNLELIGSLASKHLIKTLEGKRDKITSACSSHQEGEHQPELIPQLILRQSTTNPFR